LSLVFGFPFVVFASCAALIWDFLPGCLKRSTALPCPTAPLAVDQHQPKLLGDDAGS
jgi:hypothetical protein